MIVHTGYDQGLGKQYMDALKDSVNVRGVTLYATRTKNGILSFMGVVVVPLLPFCPLPPLELTGGHNHVLTIVMRIETVMPAREQMTWTIRHGDLIVKA